MLPRRCSGKLYDILHVAKDATPSEIKKAYHRLALELHPDKTGGATTEEFKAIQEANSILSDTESRKRYDTFGRKGMVQMENYGVPPELFSPQLARAVLLFLNFFVLLIVTFVALVVSKIDNGKKWSWSATWTPMFVACSLMVILITPNVKKMFSGDLSFTGACVTLEMLLFLVCNATLASALDGHLPWNRAMVPFFLLIGVESIRTFWENRFSQFKAFHERMGTHGASEMRPTHSLYLRQLATEVLALGSWWAFFSMWYLRAALPDYSGLSFWVMFSPFLVRIVVFVAGFATFIYCPEGEQTTKDRVSSMLTVVVFTGAALYTICMAAQKLQVEVNHTKGRDPSAAVVCIFVFLTLGLLCLLFCFSLCILPSALREMQGEFTPEEGTPIV